MTDPVKAMLDAGLVPSVALPPTSRYARVGVTVHTAAPEPGAEPAPIAHLRRRWVPRPDRLALLHEYACVQGDRRDLVAAAQLGDPELWWQLADANGVIDPVGMTDPVGRLLRITLPEGSGG
jgi:hypothetical protein